MPVVIFLHRGKFATRLRLGSDANCYLSFSYVACALFIDIYAHLDENERIVYQQRYPQEAADMTGFAERFIEQGRQEGEQSGIQQGMQRGEARILTRQLTMRFGALTEVIRQRIDAADADTLLKWSERVLTAQNLDDVLQEK